MREATPHLGQASPHPVLNAGWGFAALALVGIPAVAGAQATKAGTRIVNQAIVNHLDPSGGQPEASSNPAVIEVGRVAGVRLEPPRDTVATRGSTIVFQHRLTNLGNAMDSFTLAGHPPVGGNLRFVLDGNGDGRLDANDQPIGNPIVLASGAAIDLLAVVTLPGGLASGGAVDSVSIFATSRFDPAIIARLVDRIQLQSASLTLSLAKVVDRATAVAGDLVTYRIGYSITGSGTAVNFQIVDPIPDGSSYHPESLSHTGSSPTAGSGVASFDPATNRIVVEIPAVTAGDSGTVRFQVRADSTGSLTNVATGSYQAASGRDSVASNVTVTAVAERPRATLRKELVGTGRARIGDTVQYRLRYGNESAQTAIVTASITDSLPTGLTFSSSQPAPTVAGRVLRWDLGDLAPGQSGEVLLRAVVGGSTQDSLMIRNGAWFSASNAAAVGSVAAALAVVAPGARSLELTKTADLLEVGLGETAPFTVVVRNTGTESLADIVVHDLLPADSRYAAATVSGADSVTARGRQVTFFVAGPLAPGGSRTIRYAAAVVSASTRVLENTAFATADAGAVRSADAIAWVRIRAEAPMTTRVVIGKVWVDRNGDQMQQPGEPGVEGADIWTDDGEVSTTDQAGRFSFRNIRLGRHGFRLDPGSIPAERALADPRVGADLIMLDVTGWTTPRVSFRLAPKPGPVGAVPIRDSTHGSRRSEAVAPVRVAALRQDGDRTKDRSRNFLNGPGVEFFSPGDGHVLRLDRVFVGVRGEPGRPIALFDGDSLLAEATLRPDGVYDFLAVPLTAGPHRLRIRITNSWSAERWDSLTVHVSGRPASFVTPTGPVLLAADGKTVVRSSVLVRDHWGIPVVNRPSITIEATGAEAANSDEDPSSVGVQVAPDSTGWLDLLLRPGRVVTHGRVRLSHADRTSEFPIEVVAAAQPLLVAAVGQVGLGASAEAMGAVTVRGRLDRRTAVVASFDSRHLDAGRDVFGRNADPFEEAQYPILGDASAQRTVSASRYRLAARIDRGFDWLALGDVSTGVGAELRLGGYRRALPGAAARVTTGPVVWQAFGSSTSQLLRQSQFRGAGISGPYLLGGEIRPGTDQVAIEVRAEDNAARILSREVLVRYLDYQIDYQTGVLLLRRPVPAADPYGSPVFITVGYESDGGGPNSQVWGIRAAVDGGRVLAIRSVDSLRIGATWVREAPGAGDRTLVGTDLRFRRSQAFEVGAELSHAQSRDSSGVAVAVDGAVNLLDGAAKLTAGWLSVGREFANPSNPALRGGTSELRLAGDLTGSSRSLSLAHEWQRFTLQEAKRRRTTVTMRQAVGAAFRVEATGAAERYEGPSLDQNSVAGELTVRWQPKGPWSVWTEARHQFSGAGASLRPDYVGAGAGYQVSRAVSIEMRHRRALLSDGAADYSVTDLGVRGRLGLGTEGYGSYQLTGIEGARSAALIGVRNRLRLGDAWSLNTMMERRIGLDRAAVFDPVRALPFLQAEESYWSAGLGAEFLPSRAPYRVSSRGEFRNGDFQRTRFASVIGELAFTQSLALLTRQELLRTEHRGSGAARKTHRYSSLWGVAFRPIQSDALNVLVKFEWIDADQAAFGGLATGPAGRGRTVFAAEGIGQPARGLEFAARYAHRRASGGGSADGGGRASHSSADFIGWRGAARLMGPVELRVDARLLRERTSHTTRSDVAPFIVLLPGHTVEVSAGYRMGDLRDPDFAVRGGRGWFLTADARVTEQTIRSVADFWRARLGSNGGSR